MADRNRGNEKDTLGVAAEEPAGTRPGVAESRPGEPSRANLTDADRNVQELVDRILVLPLRAQLGIIRTLAPRAVAQLDGQEQGAYMRDLFNDINNAIHGQEVYDVRPEPH